MDEITRYEPFANVSEPDMREDEHGDYVLHEDYVSAVTSLLAALRPLTPHYEEWMKRWADTTNSSSYKLCTFGDIRRANEVLVALSPSTPPTE